jgi:iron complex outermembrane receptor protein
VNYKAAGKLNLYADLQYRTIVHEMEGIDDDLRDIGQEHEYRFWNPKAGATFELSNRQRLAVSVATGHREPNRSNFVDADPSHPLPAYETLIDYELSYRLSSTRATLETNMYFMDYDNQLVLTGEINDVGNPIMKNMKDSYRTGIEVITGIIFDETLRWDLNLTLSRNRIRNFTDYVDDWDNYGTQQARFMKETEISFSPAVIGGSKITFEPVKGLKASLMSKYVGKQYIDNSSTEEYTLDPYFVNDLQISYAIQTDFIKEVSLNLLLNNILNAEYESNAWIYKYHFGGTEYRMDGYFPQAGFNFIAGVTLGF